MQRKTYSFCFKQLLWSRNSALFHFNHSPWDWETNLLTKQVPKSKKDKHKIEKHCLFFCFYEMKTFEAFRFVLQNVINKVINHFDWYYLSTFPWNRESDLLRMDSPQWIKIGHLKILYTNLFGKGKCLISKSSFGHWVILGACFNFRHDHSVKKV